MINNHLEMIHYLLYSQFNNVMPIVTIKICMSTFESNFIVYTKSGEK
jgi:hypothetical protein